MNRINATKILGMYRKEKKQSTNGKVYKVEPCIHTPQAIDFQGKSPLEMKDHYFSLS